MYVCICIHTYIITIIFFYCVVAGPVYGGDNGEVGGKNYPMAKKMHSLEFLREKAHLRPRSKVRLGWVQIELDRIDEGTLGMVLVDTYIFACINTYIHTYIHTYIRTYVYTMYSMRKK